MPTISTSWMLQRKLVLTCPIHVELAPAPPARANFRVALLINLIKASWTMSRSRKASPCFAWLTRQVIVRSQGKLKKTSDHLWAEKGGAVSLSARFYVQGLALAIVDRPNKKSRHLIPGPPPRITTNTSSKVRKHLYVRFIRLLTAKNDQTLSLFFLTNSSPFTSAIT